MRQKAALLLVRLNENKEILVNCIHFLAAVIVFGLYLVGCAGTQAILMDRSATGLYVCGYVDDHKPQVEQDLQCVSMELYKQHLMSHRL